jgi:hypothetical protein
MSLNSGGDGGDSRTTNDIAQVKAKANEIDTTKLKENLAKARDSASATLAQARVMGEV